jgi:hypothetical protein
MPQEDLSCRSMTRVYMRIVFVLRGLTFSSPQFFRDMQEAVIKEIPYMDTFSLVIHSNMRVGKTVVTVRTSAKWGIVFVPGVMEELIPFNLFEYHMVVLETKLMSVQLDVKWKGKVKVCN